MYLPSHINPIIKLTEKCNYACEFCRYSNHRQSDKGIPEHLIIKMITECYDYNKKNGIKNMNVILHGGEPLLYGENRLSKVLDEIKCLIEDDFSIEYSIQTNSSLLSDGWIKIFKDYNFDVGISLDGPIQLNGHYGSNREDAVNDAVAAYHLLQNQGIHCGFLSVITDKHLENINCFFDFLIQNDIKSVGLCYCYNKFDGDSIDPIKLGKWLIDLYELYFSSLKKIRIREFDMVTRRILNHPHNACAMSCRESCGSYLTITPSGGIEFCDDYDLDEARNNSLGNINDMSIIQILENDKYQRMKQKSLEIVNGKCNSCEVFELCRSGCSRNDIEEINYFCDTYKMLYPHIQKRVLEYLEKRGR